MGFLKKGLTESINLDGFISPYVCIFIIISRIRPVKKFQPILSWSKVWETHWWHSGNNSSNYFLLQQDQASAHDQ